MARISFRETGHEVSADLVALLADQRSDRGGDVTATAAERFHRIDGLFQHARQRALPAGVRGGDGCETGTW